MTSLALTFDLLARDAASSKFRDVGNSAERAGKQTSTFGSTVGSAMKLAGAAFLGAGLVEGFKNFYQAADESRKIAALTGAVIKSTGGAANVSAKQVSDLAAAIAAKTGVDDEAIQSGQNLLLTFTNVKNEVGSGNDIFNQATVALTDMSVALGKDSASSAILLGKALNDPIKGMGALSRAGVQFTAEQKEQIKTLVATGDVLGAQKIILGELTTQFGGAAEAAATPLDKLKVRAGNLAEQIGGYLVPAIDKAATFVSDKMLPAFEATGAFLNATAVPAFKAIGTVVGTVADVFNSIPGPVQVGLVALGAVAALKGPVSSALETIGLRALYMKDAIAGAGSVAGGFKAAGSGLVGFLGGPWGLAIAGATVGLTLFTSWLGKTDDATKEADAAQRDFAAALKESNGALNENVRAAAAKAAQDAELFDLADNADISLSRVTDAVLGNSAAYKDVTTSLDAYLQRRLDAVNGNTEDIGFVATAEAVATYKANLDKLAPTVSETQGQQQQLAEATATSAAATETFSQKIEAARTELDEGKRAIDEFKLALDILSGGTVSLIEVESAFQSAVAQAKDAMKELGGEVLTSTGALNLQSENGRIAADVLLDVRNSGNTLISTLKEQGATTEVLAARDAELRASFINTAGQMGITGAQAETLADQILGIPAERNTTITADTSQAEGQIAAFMATRRTITIGTRTVTARVGSTFDQAGPGYALGGYTGDGGKFEPKGVVHGGEFVFTKEETAKAGPSALGRLAKSLRSYARGGWVNGSQLGSIQIPTSADTSGLAAGLEVAANAAAAAAGSPGSGALGGGWASIFNAVKAVIPQARANSTFRPGDPGYHGRGKAVDFGFGSGPGGAGSAGLASINRLLHDRFGSNLAELIYDGIGDDRPDLKNGRPLTYNAGTRAAHRNHVHAAVYDGGGLLPPGLTVAYNGTGQNETVRTAGQEAALNRPAMFTGNLYLDTGAFLGVVRGEMTDRDNRRGIEREEFLMAVATPVDVAVNPNDSTQRYVLWGNGRIDAIGGAPPITGQMTWYDDVNQPTVVALHIANWATGAGYMLDRQGANWAFNGATAAPLFGVPYIEGGRRYVDWSWDPAGTGQGYVLDHYGQLYPFGGATAAPRSGSRWSFPAAKKLAMQWTPTKRGAILDLSGEIWADFGATIGTRTVYWAGQDHARDFQVTDWTTGSGYVLDLFGGVFPFGVAPTSFGGPYRPGADVARTLTVLSSTDPIRLWQVHSGGQSYEYISSTPPTVVAGGGVNEVQTVTITGAPTGGTFTLTYAGQTTAAIARNATASTVDAALEALSNIGAGDVTVTGGPGPATPWVVTFGTALAWTDVAQMTATSSLTGGTAPAVSVVTTTSGITPSPAATVTSTTRPTLSWSYSDPQKDSQAEWQLYVFTQTFVNANTMTDPSIHAASALVNETGINRTTRGITTPVDLANGSYRMYVRAKDTAGQWSPWSNHGWTQSITMPATPTGLTATPNQTTMTVALSVSATTGGAANLVRFECSDDDGVTWQPVRGADARPLLATTTATDYDPPLGVARQEYRAKAYAINPAVASLYSSTATATITTSTYALTAVGFPALGGRVTAQEPVGWTRTAVAGVFQGVGSEYATVVSDGKPKSRKTTMHVITLDVTAWNVIQALAEADATLVYRDPFGEVIYCRLVGDWSQNLYKGAATRHMHTTDLPLVEVRPPHLAA